jgi:phage shock protein E
MNNNVFVIVLAVGLIALGLLRRRLIGGGAIASGRRIQELIDAGALVVDVRTPEEFAEGHAAGALNIPLDEIVQRSDELGEPSRQIVLYCGTGNRSGQAIARLRRKGFRAMTNGGGLDNMPRA